MSEGIPSPPVPPPPPPVANFNIAPVAFNDNNNRSHLLADIRNGATLKKTSAAMLNSTGLSTKNISSGDIVKKQTQDALQAELSNTLRRRKPVVIDEPPKYKYPIYDEPASLATTKTNESFATSTSNINYSDKESINNNNNKNINNVKSVVSKQSNVNAVLSVVTGIKIPVNFQFDTNNNNGINKTTKPITASTLDSTTDKPPPPKISHGKPNFIINRNDSASALCKQREKDSVKSNDNKIVYAKKFSAPNNTVFQSTVLPKPKVSVSWDTVVDNSKPIKSVKPSIPTDAGNELKSYGEVSSTLKKFNAMKTKPMDTATPVCTSNRISFVPVNNLVANKKALFEPPHQSIDGKNNSSLFQTKKLPATKTYSHNDIKPNNNGSTTKVFGIHKNLNRTASAESYQRSTSDSVSMAMNKNPIKTNETINTASIPMNVSKATATIDTNPNELNGYCKQTSTLYGTKSIDTKNFEQKTFVSFSKDLLNAPNMYPEQIRVVKKAIVTTETHHLSDNGIGSAANFQNIRFSIGPNAQVVSKKK